MSTIAAAAQTADRIDYWIRRHVIQYCYGSHPSQSQTKFNSARVASGLEPVPAEPSLTVSWTLQPYRTHSASIRPPEPPTILYGPPQCRSIISIASCRLLTRIRPSSENSTLMVSED